VGSSGGASKLCANHMSHLDHERGTKLTKEPDSILKSNGTKGGLGRSGMNRESMGKFTPACVFSAGFDAIDHQLR